MAVTANTPGRIYLGAGDVTVGGTPVGATVEDTVLRWEMEQYFPDFNGVKGDVDQTGFILRAVPYLEVTLAELDAVKLAWGLPGITPTSDVSSEVLSDWIPGCKPAGQDLVWTGQDCDGHDITVNLYNAIVENNLELNLSDSSITTYRLIFKGLYDPSNPTVAPFDMTIDIA